MIGRSKWQPYYLILPAIVAILLMVGFPLLYGIGISFSNMNLITFRNPQFNGLSNYIELFKSKALLTDLARTIIWTVINVFFHMTGGIFFALLLNRKLPGKNIYRVLLMIPWAIPQYIAVLAWKNMFRGSYGAIDIVLNNLGITGISWLGDPSWTFIACIIVNIWLGIPFQMATILGGLQSIPSEIYEAAELDGVNSWTKFKNLTLPLLKPVLVPITVLGTVMTFNMINVIVIMTDATGSDQTQILVTRVYNQAFTYFNYGNAAATSVVIFLLLVAFSATFIKFMKGDKGVYE